MHKKKPLKAALMLAVLAVVAGKAWSVEFYVNTTNDTEDVVPGDGSCADVLAQCSLRAALMEAGATAGTERPSIILPSATYVVAPLEWVGGGLLFGTSFGGTGGAPVIEGASSGAGRILTLKRGNFAEAHFALSGIRTVGGQGAEGGTVAGVEVEAGTAAIFTGMELRGHKSHPQGGAVLCAGQCTFEQVWLRDNEAVPAQGQVHSAGGALFVTAGGSAVIRRSTFSGNAAALGGAIATEGAADLTNSTVSANAAQQYGNSNQHGVGGAVHVAGSGGDLQLSNVTLAFNTAVTLGGGVYIEDGTAGMRNSILASNLAAQAADDCSSGTGVSITSNGYNLFGAASCPRSGGGSDQVGTADAPLDPLLLPLTENEAAWPTHAPDEGSPAIDAGHPDGCRNSSDAPIRHDQRGVERDHRCDVGAHEAPSASPPPKRAGGGGSITPALLLAASAVLLLRRRRRG